MKGMAISDIYLRERPGDRLSKVKVQGDSIELLRQYTCPQERTSDQETVREVNRDGHTHLNVTAAWSGGGLRFSQYAFTRKYVNTWETEQSVGYAKKEEGGAVLIELSAAAQASRQEDEAKEAPAGTEAKNATATGTGADVVPGEKHHGKALGHLKQSNWK